MSQSYSTRASALLKPQLHLDSSNVSTGCFYFLSFHSLINSSCLCKVFNFSTLSCMTLHSHHTLLYTGQGLQPFKPYSVNIMCTQVPVLARSDTKLRTHPLTIHSNQPGIQGLKLKLLYTEPKEALSIPVPQPWSTSWLCQQLTQLAGCITVTLHIPSHGPRHVSCSCSTATVR